MVFHVVFPRKIIVLYPPLYPGPLSLESQTVSYDATNQIVETGASNCELGTICFINKKGPSGIGKVVGR